MPIVHATVPEECGSQKTCTNTYRQGFISFYFNKQIGPKTDIWLNTILINILMYIQGHPVFKKSKPLKYVHFGQQIHKIIPRFYNFIFFIKQMSGPSYVRRASKLSNSNRHSICTWKRIGLVRKLRSSTNAWYATNILCRALRSNYICVFTRARSRLAAWNLVVWKSSGDFTFF